MKEYNLGDTVSISRKYFELTEKFRFPDKSMFTGTINRITLSIGGGRDYFIIFPDFWGDGYSQHEVWIRDVDMKVFVVEQ